MSQNFSNKSDIFIPELMELDSYWQKAVEDAICDTLKGEKRLHYALRNRKKINQKLEKLGLKPIPTQLSFLKSAPQGMESKEKLESGSEASPDEGNSDCSRTENEEARPENNQRNPDKSLFAVRSLEKMKKSQNSFNCEPMGRGDSNDDMSESNAEEEDTDERFGERNKKIRWLHVRDDGDFDDSDSESAFAFRRMEKLKSGSSRHISHKDRNFTKSGLRLPHVDDRNEEVPTEAKNTKKRTPGLRRKMHLALAKKDALLSESRGSSNGSSSIEIKVEPLDDIPEKKKKDRSSMPPFIRFYLEVYRELCHKYSAKHITEEAARRWWGMTPKQKALYTV